MEKYRQVYARHKYNVGTITDHEARVLLQTTIKKAQLKIEAKLKIK